MSLGPFRQQLNKMEMNDVWATYDSAFVRLCWGGDNHNNKTHAKTTRNDIHKIQRNFDQNQIVSNARMLNNWKWVSISWAKYDSADVCFFFINESKYMVPINNDTGIR